jgi:hypothetical protein
MIYEIMSGETVINTIVAEEAFMQVAFPGGNYRLQAHTQPQEPVQTVWKWYLDIGPFFDRFGAVKMQVLVSSDAGVQALIKDIQIRKWIDLQNAEVAQGLAYIGTKVTTLTAELQASILTTPVTDDENMALRKLYFT